MLSVVYSSKYARTYLVYYVLVVYMPSKTRKFVGKICNQRCMCAVHAKHDAYGSILKSCVYTHALNVQFTSLIFRAHAGFSERCRVVKLPHVCVVKFKLGCTIWNADGDKNIDKSI